MALSPARQLEIETQLGALRASLGPDELVWASGYMAGLAAAAGSAVAATQTAPASGTVASETLTIWYGSETGNGRGVARRLAEAARQKGYPVDLASLDEIPPRRIARAGLLMLVVSTHGEGDPPEGTEGFFEFLASERAPELADLKFAIFALGDSSYPDFCQTGRDLDERLAALGATRLLERVDCDVDFETQEDPWREQVLETVKPLLEADGAQPHLQVVRKGAPTTAASHDRRNPYPAEVLECSPLTVAPSNKRVAHLALSLEGSGLTWLPGDSLGVWPANDARLVDEIIETIGADGDTVVERDNQQLPLATWLGRHLELTQVVRPFVEAWADLAASRELAGLLEDRDALQAWSRARQVADVLREYPARAGAAGLVGALRRIAPRLYSIASSPLTADDEVHLTVKLEGGEQGGLLRAGAASWQLLEGVRPGDTVPIYIEANDRFRLPDDSDRPVIMIGPGTGVAPFRAFVEHRQAQGATGKNWLFFGEQHRRTDFLYQLEWQRFLREGALDRLSVAFSRDQADKLYVQHRLRESGADVYAWLEDGAHVYVCGNGQGMAADVHQALIDVIAAHGGRGPDAAAEYLAAMKTDNRYQKDVY